VVEEGPPTVQVPFAEPRMADREPGGCLGRAVIGTTAPYGGVALRGQAQDGEQHDQYEIHGLHRASSTIRTRVRRARPFRLVTWRLERPRECGSTLPLAD